MHKIMVICSLNNIVVVLLFFELQRCMYDEYLLRNFELQVTYFTLNDINYSFKVNHSTRGYSSLNLSSNVLLRGRSFKPMDIIAFLLNINENNVRNFAD